MVLTILLLVLIAVVWGIRLWVAHLIDTKQILGDEYGTPYMVRYFISKPNTKAKGRIYLHHFLRSDHDRALHDHPWNFVSIILRGGYWEFADNRAIPFKDKAGSDRDFLSDLTEQPEDKAYTIQIEREKMLSAGFQQHDSEVKPDKYIPASVAGQSFRWFGPGSILRRGAGWRHRVSLPNGKTAWTLIYTSPKVREWGFWPGDRFCHWTKYDSAIGVCNEPKDLKDRLTLYRHEQICGYDWNDIERVMSAVQFSNFKDWMRGKGMSVLDGKSIVYAWDFDKFLAGQPAYD